MEEFQSQQNDKLVLQKSQEIVSEYLDRYLEESQKEICKLLATDSNISQEEYEEFASLKVHLVQREGMSTTEIAKAAEECYNEMFAGHQLKYDASQDQVSSHKKIEPLQAAAHQIDYVRIENRCDDCDSDDSDIADLYNGEITREEYELYRGDDSTGDLMSESESRQFSEEMYELDYGPTSTMRKIAEDLDTLDVDTAVAMSEALEKVRSMSVNEIAMFQKLLFLAREDYQDSKKNPYAIALEKIDETLKDGALDQYEKNLPDIDVEDCIIKDTEDLPGISAEDDDKLLKYVIEWLWHSSASIAEDYFDDHVKDSFKNYREQRLYKPSHLFKENSDCHEEEIEF